MRAPPRSGTTPRADTHEIAVVGLSTAAALVVLRLVNTQIYTEPWTIDPWLYTALMTNFDFIYPNFVATVFVAPRRELPVATLVSLLEESE